MNTQIPKDTSPNDAIIRPKSFLKRAFNYIVESPIITKVVFPLVVLGGIAVGGYVINKIDEKHNSAMTTVAGHIEHVDNEIKNMRKDSEAGLLNLEDTVKITITDGSLIRQRLDNCEAAISETNKVVLDLHGGIKDCIDKVEGISTTIKSNYLDLGNVVSETNNSLYLLKGGITNLNKKVDGVVKKTNEVVGNVNRVGKKVKDLEEKLGLKENGQSVEEIQPISDPVSDTKKSPTSDFTARLGFGSGIEGRADLDVIGKDRGWNLSYLGGDINSELKSGDDYTKKFGAIKFELWGVGDNRLKIGLIKGIEEEKIISNSSDYSNHPLETEPFEQWNFESQKEENTTRLTSITGDKYFKDGKLNVLVGYSDNTKTTKNKYDIDTFVTFSNPSILPFNSSTDVKTKTILDERTLFSKVIYNFGNFELGGIAKSKSLDVKADVDVDGSPAGYYHDEYKMSSLGASFIHKAKDASRSVTFIKNSGDDVIGKNRYSYDITLVNEEGGGIGGGKDSSGENYGCFALSLWGDKPSQNTTEILRKRQDDRIYPERLLPNQRFFNLYDILPNSDNNGMTIFGEKGKGKNYTAGAFYNYKDEFYVKGLQEIVDEDKNLYFEIGRNNFGFYNHNEKNPGFDKAINTTGFVVRKKF